MKKLLLLSILLINLMILFACNSIETSTISQQTMDNTPTTYVKLSARFINTLRNKGDIQPIIDSLANVDQDVLANELTNDKRKKVFWMNVYNGFIQVLLHENSNLYESKNSFFNTKQMTVAGKFLSFDDIEHGIIRRSKIKLSLGFLSKWFVSDYEKKFRINKIDERVHFALNCGAKSCPAVMAYDVKKLEEQMDKASFIHLKATSLYDEKTNTVYITSLFSWFRGDFGNKNEVRKFLKKYKIIPQTVKGTTLSYNKYDWTLYLDNYIE